MSLEEIKKYYQEVFYVEDTTILDLMCAIAISVYTKSDSIWLLIIGAPSSGKTEFVNTLAGLEYAHQVSTLTENAFLSGMGGSDGKEKSLLHKIGDNGLLLMKDYTSILSLKEELRKKILGDMREIYEQHLSKSTGNGRDMEWKGKINFVGAVTDSIYLNEGDDASMGRRTIDYVMPTFSDTVRIKMAKRSSRNIGDANVKREKIRVMFAEFIEQKRKDMPMNLPELPEELEDELIVIADFSTKMRTATKRDFHGNLTFAPGSELPMRMTNQLTILAQVLIYLNDGVLKQEHHDILIKIALDSISRQRRITLQVMAKYNRVTTKGVAQALNYPTKTTLQWLEDVNVLKGCTREMVGTTDMWILTPEFKAMMCKYDNITAVNLDLLGTETAEDYMSIHHNGDDPGLAAEYEKNKDEAFRLW
jgi:energy-coupling factor transporter ATP-binding protein EcfA2